ncbi:hypothetical protein CN918_29805 [Priestia megaterium]|nr:hypothetical protein CN918_29805 [Priestia megaterium]
MTQQKYIIYSFPQGYAATCDKLLEDMPGRVRKSFHTSLQNVIIAQIGKRKSRDAVELVDSDFITDVLVHMRNIATYGGVWVDYVFGVSEDNLKRMIVKKIQLLNDRKVSDHEIKMYQGLADYVVNYLKKDNEEAAEREKSIWLPVPTDFFEYSFKRKLLTKRQTELWDENKIAR